MARTYSVADVAAEAEAPEDQVEWIARIGLISPVDGDRFTYGAVLAVRMVSALLEHGIAAATIEHATTERLLSFHRLDEYVPYEPGPRSERTFEAFQASLGARGRLLPAVYEVLGLPEPDPSKPIHADEEDLFERFLEGLHVAPDDDSVLRAARLMAQSVQAATMGWSELIDEQAAQPARERLLRHEIEEFPDEVRLAFTRLTSLAPTMFTWLSARYLQHRSVNGIVAGLEEFLASRDLAPAPEPTAPPAIVFVDLSGYTRMTQERGDETAARAATSLQRHADAEARRLGGRLIKLLGDGAMLRLPDPTVGVDAAVELVDTMSGEGAGSPHAGVHAGPVIERDLDVFGQTVNLASRIADAASPGEVLASLAVVEGIADGRFAFEAVGDAELKGLPEPVALFRVSRRDGSSEERPSDGATRSR